MSVQHPATRQQPATRPAVEVPAEFQVGPHVVRLACAQGRWTVSVDSVAFDRWFMSQAAAWEAGVREADRLDRPAP
jgi:hypothetical protein